MSDQSNESNPSLLSLVIGANRSNHFLLVSSAMASFSSPPSSQKTSIDPSDCKVPQPGSDGISSLSWSPTNNNLLASGSWDSHIRCWQIQEELGDRVQAQPMAMTGHANKAPVLSTTFSTDGSAVFSGGGDKAVRLWKLEGGQQEVAPQIGAHDAPVKCVGYLPKTNVVVSGGWDKKLKFWDPRQSPNQPALVLDMPERVHALDVRGNLLAVATHDRQVSVYDVAGAPRELSRKKSPLSYQTRSIAVFPDETGFAIGSIEGKVGLEYVRNAPAGKESFAFKCHRKVTNALPTEVFAVNDICFHSQHIFATIGADGCVLFWNKDEKRRLKDFGAINRPVSCASFNTMGNLFAYASSYDWSKGISSYSLDAQNEVFIHRVTEDEIKKPKSNNNGRRR